MRPMSRYWNSFICFISYISPAHVGGKRGASCLGYLATSAPNTKSEAGNDYLQVATLYSPATILRANFGLTVLSVLSSRLLMALSRPAVHTTKYKAEDWINQDVTLKKFLLESLSMKKKLIK